MSQGNSAERFSQSNKTKPCVCVKSDVQTDDRKSLLGVTSTEKSNNEVKGVDHHARPQLDPKYGTHFDFAPWLGSDGMEQSSTGSIRSISELKTVLDDPQKRKEMLLKYDTVYRYNSFNNVIILDEEEEDIFNDSSETSLENASEDEIAELRRKMLGYFD